MASEAVVSFVAGKHWSLVAEEVGLLSEVHDEFAWIEKQLTRMISSMKEADAKREDDERVRNWIAEIRDISYDAEDVIDIYILHQITKIVQRRRLGLVSYVKRCICIVSELKTRHQVGKEIRRIKQKIDNISSSLSTYGIRNITNGGQETSLNDRRRSSSLFEEPDVVGLQESVNTLRKQLINEEARRCVISIVGMGGSGKTTLAKKVYRNVKDDFDCLAFIYLSQQYRIRDVLIRILECVMSLSRDEIEELNEQKLMETVRDHLTSKKYLVVIDDIWTMPAWDEIQHCLPDGLDKSRVMLTTRNKEVALHADPLSCPHDIRLLDGDESWELFLKRIFPGENTSVVCPSELVETGKKILQKCHGLPLAIVVLGGLLSRRVKTLSAWSKVLDSVTWHLRQGEGSDQCMKILALSYFDLPHYLKPCFLYLGLFPEDFEIRSKELVRLWIAEGFIQQRDNEIMEDVAEDYIEELIWRSMIQVARKRCNGSVSTCRIHDLLRDLSISQASQINFFAVGGDNIDTASSSTKVRRLALYRNVDLDDTTNHSTATLRSMLYFFVPTTHLPKLLKRGGKLLRVLHVHLGNLQTYSLSLPKEIGERVHLRYLNFRSNGIGRLRSSIGNLYNLQTIILPTSQPRRLPNEIWNLERLRHLYAYGWEIDGHPRLKNLRNLQTLCLWAGSWTEDGLDELTNLRKLGINGDLSSHHKALSGAIKKLCNLQSLTLRDGIYREQNIILPSMSFEHLLKLYKIHLRGPMETLPDFPPNLAKLTWRESGLEQDAIEKLKKLIPNVRITR